MTTVDTDKLDTYWHLPNNSSSPIPTIIGEVYVVYGKNAYPYILNIQLGTTINFEKVTHIMMIRDAKGVDVLSPIIRKSVGYMPRWNENTLPDKFGVYNILLYTQLDTIIVETCLFSTEHNAFRWPSGEFLNPDKIIAWCLSIELVLALQRNRLVFSPVEYKMSQTLSHPMPIAHTA